MQRYVKAKLKAHRLKSEELSRIVGFALVSLKPANTNGRHCDG